MATLESIATHLDMTERNLRDVLKKINLNHRKTSVTEIRVGYIRHLRNQAAGRGGDHQKEAALAKIRESSATAQLKELDFYEKIKLLVPVEEIEPILDNWAVLARSEIKNAVDKIIANLESKHGIEIEQGLIDESLGSAFTAIGSYPRNISQDDVESGEEVGATT